MKDVTESVKEAAGLAEEDDADITVNINVISPNMPPEVASLGEAVHVLNKESDLAVEQVRLRSDDMPPRFEIDGVVLNSYL